MPQLPCPYLYHSRQDIYSKGYRDKSSGSGGDSLRLPPLESGDAGMEVECSTLWHLNPEARRETSLHASWNPGGAHRTITSLGMQRRQFPRAPCSGWDPLLGGAIGITPGKILITVASKVPPVTAVAGPAQEVQIIGIAGILVTPAGSWVT